MIVHLPETKVMNELDFKPLFKTWITMTVIITLKGNALSLNEGCTAPLLVSRDNIRIALQALSRLIRV